MGSDLKLWMGICGGMTEGTKSMYNAAIIGAQTVDPW
jgi:hypothetical protein